MSTQPQPPEVAATKRPPFNPPFFYGWLIVGVGVTASLFSAGSTQVFFAAVIQPMMDELGWSRTSITGALSVGTIMAGLVAPVAGYMADRFGPRVLLPLGSAMMSVAFIVIGLTTSLWQFYAAYVVSRAIAGIGVSGVVTQTTLVHWFQRRRGRAIGIFGMGSRFGTAILLPVAQLIMKWGTWRTVFLILGSVSAVLLIVPSALIMRRRPEDVGLLPDGDIANQPTPTSETKSRVYTNPHSFTLAEALRTRTLYLLIICESAGALATGAIAVHQVGYYTSIGLSPEIAGAALTAYAFAAAGSSGVWGFLTEVVSESLLITVVFLLSAVTLVGMLLIHHPVAAIIISVLYGLTSRGEGTLMSIVYVSYFGRGSFGKISTFGAPLRQFGLGAGPLLGAIAFDLMGSYQQTIVAFIVVYIAAAGLMMLARPPKTPAIAAS